ncbi:LysR family transcriptional regulator [Pseudomonas cremoricolorata]|uniref:LysR family transcriptional regulator n=1 Tax=Pseudomonas cremoricolorata TaxID=157783 RepID=UPI000410BFD3|nr:LysR family transcriptional regulator [Pseudomonas cremoricolorata]
MQASERLKGLDVFVCVADRGSFAAAAEHLNLSASAVSKSIARLEARLGLRVFERTTRRLALTEAGAAYYQTCARLLADLQHSEQALHSDRCELRGPIRIDLPAAYGRLHVLPVILDWARRYPQVQPQISFSDRFVDLAEDGIDIAVRIGGSDVWPEALGRRFIGRQHFILCAAPAYLEAHGQPRTSAQLMQHACVIYGQANGLGSPWLISGDSPGEVERRNMPARLIVGDGEAMVAALLAGFGIAQVPTWLVRQHLESGALVEVLPQLALEGLAMNVLWLKKRESLARVDALLQVLTAALRTDGHQLNAPISESDSSVT